MFKKWFIAAIIRAIRTIAQAAISFIGTSYLLSDVDWKLCISASLLSGLMSILFSLKGLPEVDNK